MHALPLVGGTVYVHALEGSVQYSTEYSGVYCPLGHFGDIWMSLVMFVTGQPRYSVFDSPFLVLVTVAPMMVVRFEDWENRPPRPTFADMKFVENYSLTCILWLSLIINSFYIVIMYNTSLFANISDVSADAKYSNPHYMITSGSMAVVRSQTDVGWGFDWFFFVAEFALVILQTVITIGLTVRWSQLNNPNRSCKDCCTCGTKGQFFDDVDARAPTYEQFKNLKRDLQDTYRSKEVKLADELALDDLAHDHEKRKPQHKGKINPNIPFDRRLGRRSVEA